VLGVWFLSHVVTRKPTAPAGEKRIAVLPFKPLLPENRDQVLELGMADTLIAKLSNSREIIVSSLNSVRKIRKHRTRLVSCRAGITGQFGP
jgi:TolB-like protein